MNTIVTIFVLLLAVVCGDVIGESYAPVSGVTVHALATRVDVLESKVEVLTERCKRLESEAETIALRIKGVVAE